jgi:hypothetical protein
MSNTTTLSLQFSRDKKVFIMDTTCTSCNFYNQYIRKTTVEPAGIFTKTFHQTVATPLLYFNLNIYSWYIGKPEPLHFPKTKKLRKTSREKRKIINK